MQTLRGWLFYFWLSITLIPTALTVVLLWPFASARFRYEKVALVWCRLMVHSLRVICAVNFRVIGAENIPVNPQTPVVLLSKHQSAWETLFLPIILGNPAGFVYKKSLHWVPFFGWALKSMQMIAIDRKEGRSAYQIFLERGKAFVKRGWWVLLFPEGTRTKPGDKETVYKTGGARFALAVGAVVVPIALNSGRCWPRNSIRKIPGTITVSIGPAIATDGKSAHELTQEVRTWIETEIERFESQEN